MRRTHTRSGIGCDRYLLRRNTNPLRHDVADVGPLEDDEVDIAEGDGVDDVVAQLDALDLPDGIGRPTAVSALRDAGYSFSTARLMGALKVRQARS